MNRTAAIIGSANSVDKRRGVAALIALVCLSVATIIGTLLLKASLGEHQYLSRVELKSQGDWLVEAGFSRAAARLANSQQYAGETWKIPGSSFGRTQDATVRIAMDRPSATVPRRTVHVAVSFSQSSEPAIEAVRDFSSR
jgi:type II secretory pathway component PulK